MTFLSKKSFFYISLIIVLIMGAASAIAFFNEDRVRNITINQLNTLLDTEVNVENIEFSLLKRFPKASIQFKSIVIKEKSTSKSPENLLEATSLFLEFNPLDLLTHNYVIDVIYFENAKLNLKVYQDGSNNFQFVKSDTTNNDFIISLKKVVLKNSTLLYKDDFNSVNFKSELNSMVFAGEFESEEFVLSSKADGVMDYFHLNSFRSKRSQNFELDVDLAINKKLQLFSFNNSEIIVGPLAFNSKGTYQSKNGRSDIDIQFKTASFSFQKVLYTMPENIQQYLNNYHVEGNVEIEGRINGSLDKAQSPDINLAFSLSEGQLIHKESSVKIRDIGLKGSLNNGDGNKAETSIFNLNEVQFTGKHGTSQGSLSITNFNDPYLKFEFNSILSLNELEKLIDSDTIEQASGVLEYYIKAETYLDSLSDFNLKNLKSMKTSGNLSLTNASIKFKDYQHKISEVNAKARFGNNVIHIDTLGYKVGDVFSTIKGKFSNFLPYIFFDNEKMRAQASIYYPNLEVDKYLSQKGSGNTGFFLPVSPLVELDLKLKADKFSFKRFKAENVECEILSKHPYFIVQNLNLEAMEGTFVGWIQLNVSDLQSLHVSSELTLHHVNIESLFYQFENFGQKEIISENIQGFANASIDVKGKLNKDFEIIQESIEAHSHIEVLNGRLINYETIMALSKYVDVDELKDIKFSKLTNDIQIKNKVVIIPEMEIKSSALELWLAGKQSFEGAVDYHFTLWLNDFLFKKAKRSNKKKEEFGEVEMDKEGRAKLFLYMTGTVDNYKIKLDKKALREKWNSDLKIEKEELKDLFKLEFGKDNKKEHEAPQQFEMEWEELDIESEQDTKQDQSPTKFDAKDIKEKESPIIDKLGGKKIEDEYEEYDPDKFD